MALKLVAVGEIPSPDDGDIVGVLLAGDWDAVREAAKLFGKEVVVSRRPAEEVREGWHDAVSTMLHQWAVQVLNDYGVPVAACDCDPDLSDSIRVLAADLAALPTPPKGERG